MSGIAGIYHRDGEPVDPQQLDQMARAASHRGPDGIGKWVHGPVGMAHLMCHTTPESLHEKQPLLSEDGQLCLILDGRIDNREELAIRLHQVGVHLRAGTDAELLLQAYAYWGKECLKSLLGDFAFVVWDRPKKALFCARDHLGLRPFYYCLDSRYFLWGSELHQLLTLPQLPQKPNEGMAAEFLADAITSPVETLYENILRLEPAHFILVEPQRILKQRYWEPNPSFQIQHKSDQEYARHFLEILKDAVRCRLRSRTPIGIELSGGIDSSSVAATTWLLLHERKTPTNPLQAFSLIFPGMDCDESPYFEEVVKHYQLISHRIPPVKMEESIYLSHVSRYKDFPDHPNGAMSYPLKMMAAERDHRVLLTGTGSDQWLTGSLYYAADQIRSGQLFQLFPQLRHDLGLSDRASVISLLYPVIRFGLWPQLPGKTRRSLSRLLRVGKSRPWINSDFARRICLSDRIHWENCPPSKAEFAWENLHRLTYQGSLAHSLEMDDLSSAWFGIERRHPFYDRRVVEFLMAIPESQRCRGEKTKYVLREAMRGMLPDTIRERFYKADFAHTFVEAFQSLGGSQFLNSLAIEKLGWINGPTIRHLYRQLEDRFAVGNGNYAEHIWDLWMVFGLELWYRGTFASPDRTT